MAAYLDSAGNVNTAVASDAQSFVFAMRQAVALGQQSAQAAPLITTAATQLFTTDAVTGMPSGAVTDV
jgi:hypothetical protein